MKGIITKTKLVGIITRTVGDCAVGNPDLYVNVKYFHKWINDYISHFPRRSNKIPKKG